MLVAPAAWCSTSPGAHLDLAGSVDIDRGAIGRRTVEVQRQNDGAVPDDLDLAGVVQAGRSHRVARADGVGADDERAAATVGQRPADGQAAAAAVIVIGVEHYVAVADDAQPARGADRRSARQTEIPGDRVEAGQRAVGCQGACVRDPRVAAGQSDKTVDGADLAAGEFHQRIVSE